MGLEENDFGCSLGLLFDLWSAVPFKQSYFACTSWKIGEGCRMKSVVFVSKFFGWIQYFERKRYFSADINHLQKSGVQLLAML